MPKTKGKQYFKPSVVMSIHGYLSNGKWQSELTNAIESENLISKEFKYGFTVRFDKWKVKSLIKKFHRWYFEVVEDVSNGLNLQKPYHRPSIVAHSLGTWILVKAMQKYPEIKFDKIFLHGSIVPRKFDIYSLIIKDKVNKIVVEKSNNDAVVKMGCFFTGSIFPCCKHGFEQETTYVKYEDVNNFGHSDFQYKQRFISQFQKHLYEEPLQIQIVNGADLEMQTISKYFRATTGIDEQVYGHSYLSNSPVTIAKALEWAMVEKDIWTFMVDTFNPKKVLGYINTIAVDDNTFEQFINGHLLESDISVRNIKSFNSGGSLNIIIMSIALNNDTRSKYGGLLSSKPGELLVLALAKKLISLKRKGQKINRIASVAWTSYGENLCNSFGLKESSNFYQSHPIFTTSTDNLKLSNVNELHKLSRWWIKNL